VGSVSGKVSEWLFLSVSYYNHGVDKTLYTFPQFLRTPHIFVAHLHSPSTFPNKFPAPTQVVAWPVIISLDYFLGTRHYTTPNQSRQLRNSRCLDGAPHD
jgi:hypothetical protein